MLVFSYSMPSTAANNPPPDVTTSASGRPLASTVENTLAVMQVGGGASTWLSRQTDEQLRQAVEISELLTTSTSMSDVVIVIIINPLTPTVATWVQL